MAVGSAKMPPPCEGAEPARSWSPGGGAHEPPPVQLRQKLRELPALLRSGLTLRRKSAAAAGQRVSARAARGQRPPRRGSGGRAGRCPERGSGEAGGPREEVPAGRPSVSIEQRRGWAPAVPWAPCSALLVLSAGTLGDRSREVQRGLELLKLERAASWRRPRLRRRVRLWGGEACRDPCRDTLGSGMAHSTASVDRLGAFRALAMHGVASTSWSRHENLSLL